jgi:hypothetical protein
MLCLIRESDSFARSWSRSDDRDRLPGNQAHRPQDNGALPVTILGPFTRYASRLQDPYVLTAAGKRLYLLHPDPSVIEFDDIATGLGEIIRYAGMSVGGWNDASHTLLVAAIVARESDEATPYALLHDAHERFLGDDITPKKMALALINPAAEQARHQLEHGIQEAIHFRAGLAWPPPPHIEAMVKEADQCAFVSEVTYLLPSNFVREFDLEGLPLPADRELFKEVARLQPVPALIRAFERAFGPEVMNGACRPQMVPMPEVPA